MSLPSRSVLPRTSSANAMQLLPGSVGLYALESDIQARGLPIDDLPRRVMLIDYAQPMEPVKLESIRTAAQWSTRVSCQDYMRVHYQSSK